MTAEYPPFMYGYGMIEKAFAKIQERDVPDVFSHDYLRFTLGFDRESDRAFVALMKRIGFLSTEGNPTALYRKLHKPKNAPAAIGDALKIGYPMIYAKHPDADSIDRKTLAQWVAEFTGQDTALASQRAICGTFLTLREMANPTQKPRADDRRKAAERRENK